MSSDTLLYLLMILVAILAAIVGWLGWRFGRLVRGKGSFSIEDSIRTIAAELDRAEGVERETLARLRSIEERLACAIQRPKVIRFNAFSDAGGNQSFATALLDEGGSGVVLSSLYSRERVGVFAKPIQAFASSFQLSDEEERAIELCRTTHTPPQASN